MRGDVLIRTDGFRALFEKLEPVEAERFLVLVQRGGFDYTEWQKELWKDRSVDEIHQSATAFWKQQNSTDR